MNNGSNSPIYDCLYDPRQIRRAFDRAADHYDDHAVLQREVASRLLQRLDWLKMDPAVVLDLGAGTGEPTAKLMRRYKKAQVLALDMSINMLHQARRRGRWLRRPQAICSDAQHIPLADQTVDMVFSSLVLQWCDRPDLVFAEVKRVLKPDGVFIFSTFGPDTLKELRDSWAVVDQGQHIHPFIDMHDIGDFLIHAGLQEPVMEREEMTLTYERVRDVMRDLKCIGAVNALNNRPKGLLGRRRFERLVEAYEARRIDGRLPASYEVVYGTAWSGQTNKPGVVAVPIEQIGRRQG